MSVHTAPKLVSIEGFHAIIRIFWPDHERQLSMLFQKAKVMCSVKVPLMLLVSQLSKGCFGPCVYIALYFSRL